MSGRDTKILIRGSTKRAVPAPRNIHRRHFFWNFICHRLKPGSALMKQRWERSNPNYLVLPFATDPPPSAAMFFLSCRCPDTKIQSHSDMGQPRHRRRVTSGIGDRRLMPRVPPMAMAHAPSRGPDKRGPSLERDPLMLLVLYLRMYIFGSIANIA